MAMTLRLTEEDHAQLAAAAVSEGVSMHAFAVEAIRRAVAERARRERVLELGETVRSRHRELLDRLAR